MFNNRALIVIVPLVAMAAILAGVFLVPRGLAPSIEGYVWKQDDTQTPIQRGVYVHLLSERVTPAQVKTAAESKLAEIARRAAGASEGAGIKDDAVALEAEINKLSAPITIDDAIDLLNGKRYAKYGNTDLSDFVHAATIDLESTDVNGHYKFRTVTPGDYILTVRLPGGEFVSREVTVGRKPVKVDLY